MMTVKTTQSSTKINVTVFYESKDTAMIKETVIKVIVL